MSHISIITPSYHGDYERCKLLCKSVDKHVIGFSFHYIIVNDGDYNLFKHLEGEKRKIMKYSDVIPKRLKVIPRIFKSDYWVSWNGLPLRGWHVQQIVKISATANLPEARVCIVDSDMIFVKNIDLSLYQAPNLSPLYTKNRVIPRNKPRHKDWVNTAYKVLGLGDPDYPVDDHIGSIIFWDKTTVHAMIKRIETVTGKEWSTALQRTHKFSEYLLYGYFVNNSEFKSIHVPTNLSVCHIYWQGEPLNEERLKIFMQDLQPYQFAIGIQSFTDTPIELLEKVITL
jgi:hypothetical protein